MIVYIVCAEVPWDSYHQVVLATLNEKEADTVISEQNAKHEPDCQTQRATESDWDECFCRKYHKHSMPLQGWVEGTSKSDSSQMSDLPRGHLIRPDGSRESVSIVGFDNRR